MRRKFNKKCLSKHWYRSSSILSSGSKEGNYLTISWFTKLTLQFNLQCFSYVKDANWFAQKFAMCCWLILFLYIITLLRELATQLRNGVSSRNRNFLYLELNCILETNLFWIYPEFSSYYQDQKCKLVPSSLIYNRTKTSWSYTNDKVGVSRFELIFECIQVMSSYLSLINSS